MPFTTSKQSRACCATHGFHGKVNCKEWASKTDYKHLPKHAGMSRGMRPPKK